MSTLFDWLTMAVFAGLLVIFLQRSIGERPANDRVVNYLPPALGCAGANYCGNEGHGVVAVIIIVAVLGYVAYVIKPDFGTNKRD